MTEMSLGEQCRVHVANIRTMCGEIEELLTIGALHGFGRALGRLSDVAERMEAAVTAAADAAGAVSADSPINPRIPRDMEGGSESAMLGNGGRTGE